jgi:MFS family permease
MPEEPQAPIPEPPETLERKGWGRTFESLSFPSYRLLWIGSLTSYAALQMTNVARPWLAYDVSDSALALGVVAAFQGLPQLFMSPLGGLAADRFSKRAVLLTSTIILMTTAIVMAIMVYLDIIEVWHLALLSLVHGATVPFNHPVRQAYIPTLVPRSHMPNAVALNASGRNLNQILGPALAGVLLAVDASLAFVVIVGLHVATITLSLRLPAAAPIVRSKLSVGGDLIYGMRYVWSNTALRSFTGLAILGVALGFPYQQLLPVFQKEVFEVGPERLGFMVSFLGAGALTSSLTVASFASLVQRGYPQLIAGMLFGVGLVAFANAPSFAWALPLLFVTGFTSQSYTTMNSTQMMLAADPEFYGRVASVNMMTRSIMPLAVLPFGALVDLYGAPATVSVAGVLLAVSIFIIGGLRPELRGGAKPPDPGSTKTG